MSLVPEPLRRFGRRLRALAVVPTRRLAVVAALLAPLWLLSALPVVRWLPVIALAALALVVVLDIALLPAARDAHRRSAARAHGRGRATRRSSAIA